MRSTNHNLLCLTLFFLIFSLLQPIFAIGKADSYDELIKSGSVEDVKKAFRNDNDMHRTRIGVDKDTILMKAIKYDRSESFIKLMINSGVDIKAKNKQGQTALIYTCKYSTDDNILKIILKKYGSKKAVRKAILQADDSGMNALDYSKQNSSPNTLNYLKTVLPEEDWNPSTKLETIQQSEKQEQNEDLQKDEIKTSDSNEIAEEETQTLQKESENSIKDDFATAQPQQPDEKTAASTENAGAAATEESIGTTVSAQIPLSQNDAIAETAKTDESVKTNSESSDKNKKQETEQEKNNIQNTKNSANSELKSTKVAPSPSSVTKYERTYLYDYAPKEDEIISEPQTNGEELIKIENPNQKDKNGKTPLMTAIKNGNDWEIRSLLKSGADVNAKDNEGWSALMYAIRYQNNLEFVNILIQNGADVNSKNKYGSTPLQIAACYSDNPEILKRIILTYPSGSSEIFKAFILSITSNSSSLVSQIAKLKVFINRGLPMNRFYEGKTPLMYAAEYANSTQVIKLLLDSGAIPSIRNSEGKNAFDYAKTNSSLEKDEIYWSLNNR